MECKRCGAVISNNSEKCEYCGMIIEKKKDDIPQNVHINITNHVSNAEPDSSNNMNRTKKKEKKPKKPIWKRISFWVLIVLIALIWRSCAKSDKEQAQREKKRAEATANADSVLEGKVEIPETYFKTQEEVKALFEVAGLKAEFVVRNFDDAATINKRYLKAGECDQIDSDQPNVEYYDTDQVGDKYGFYAEVGATIIVGYSDHDFDGTKTEGKTDEIKDTEPIPETSVQTETNTAKETENIATEKNSETEELNNEWAEVNESIKKHLEDNQGWALGTIDSDGNPIENGEPNIEYLNWIYVKSITYEDGDVNVNVTADFNDLSDYEKDSLASSCQGIAMAYTGLTERPPIYFYNGENAYGSSKILDKTEYDWYY